VRADGGEGGDVGFDEERCREERQGEPGRVRAEQAGAGARGLERAGQRQHPGEDRPDARGPAERERHAHQSGADRAGRTPGPQPRGNETGVGFRGRSRETNPGFVSDPQHARRVEAEEHDHRAGQSSQPAQPVGQELPEEGGRGAERDEHHREARDKRQRGHEYARARGAQRAVRRPGDAREIGGNERQHEGRDERERAGREGRQQRDALVHPSATSPA
jgi:hypothetical protein